MATHPVPSRSRLRRLQEELAESGLTLDARDPLDDLLLVEIDNALRPAPHERKLPSTGSIIEPRRDPVDWTARARLDVTRRAVGGAPLASARRFADGLSSWLLRRVDGADEWAVFDRPAGSERDLVVLADALAATIVQRHPLGMVRVVGQFGVLRSLGIGWHHEPPVASWIDLVAACPVHGDRETLERLVSFAVHDLGSRGIGATLVYRPGADGATEARMEARTEARLPLPPPLHIGSPADLAPLRHALAQIDGAALFDGGGVLRQLGVRLVPSSDAASAVEGLAGMRHTSGRRYSYDDPLATVVVVSEDGPVTVMRGGELIGATSSLLVPATS